MDVSCEDAYLFSIFSSGSTQLRLTIILIDFTFFHFNLVVAGASCGGRMAPATDTVPVAPVPAVLVISLFLSNWSSWRTTQS